MQVELLHHVGTVALDRIKANVQNGRDVLIRFALREELKYFLLSCG